MRFACAILLAASAGCSFTVDGVDPAAGTPSTQMMPSQQPPAPADLSAPEDLAPPHPHPPPPPPPPPSQPDLSNGDDPNDPGNGGFGFGQDQCGPSKPCTKPGDVCVPLLGGYTCVHF